MTLALSILAALFLAFRSLTVRSLRPAAVACCAFVAIDAARLVGLPPMVDVVVFCVMPACWGALLQPEAGTRPGDGRIELAAAASTPAHLTGAFPEFAPRPIIDASASGSTAGVGFSRSGMVRAGERLKAVSDVLKFGHVASILPPLAPLALCLLFALLLLLSRHHPAVAAHWQEALAVPRLVVAGVALWVALRGRRLREHGAEEGGAGDLAEAPHGGAYVQRTDRRMPRVHGVGRQRRHRRREGLAAILAAAAAGAGRGRRGGETVGVDDNRGERDGIGHDGGLRVGVDLDIHSSSLPPSQFIGIILALGSAACVVGGLWAGDWGGVRAVSLVSWGLVVGVAVRVRE